MYEIGKRIKKQREFLELSQETLASETGYRSKASIAKIEAGESDVPEAKVLKFAKALRTTPMYLMGVEESTASTAAGASEQFEIGNAAGKYVTSVSEVAPDIIVSAPDDSMDGARIRKGDFVFVQKQKSVENNQVAIALVDDEMLLRRIFYDRRQQLLILRPENPAYDTLIFSRSELERVRILGKAVFFQSLIK